MGISLVRIDYAPYGQPRLTRILVAERSLSLSKEHYIYVRAIGMIHFQVNIGKIPAIAFAGLSSQNAVVITITHAAFGSNSLIDPRALGLAKAFQLDAIIVKELQAKFGA
ncbi:unnamed protein product [Microthlaspi erraticum]|uniref:Cupin type-1 domain-containing protein n=1 Tax=Microthlaspi erraticum TaxID=1685480 RepID=A0A6D2KQS6_9BRAS|nr:unnamed protein product [Microthlaspi erraticum]